MSLPDDDDIPILTDAVREPRPSASAVNVPELREAICASSLALAEMMLKDAMREAEHVMLERVMSALRAELPGMVQSVLNEHLDR